jgi:phosphatidate cytidylyltransferase
MAFNLQTFKTRALTAVVFVVVMLAGLLWSGWSFFLLFFIIHIGCWREYFKLVCLIDPPYANAFKTQAGIVAAGFGCMIWMATITYLRDYELLNLFGRLAMVLGAVSFVAAVIWNRKKEPLRLAAHSVMGFLYISLSWTLLMRLYGNMQQTVFSGPDWLMPVVLIASIWINDTMAYIVGSFIGKTPFSPISPKKTWEGTLGGAVLAVLVVTLVGHFAFDLPVVSLIIISTIAAVAGTAGDLFESKLKRLAGVKDSGNIMPGHGGFLDRFDSLLLATTATWLVFTLFYFITKP